MRVPLQIAFREMEPLEDIAAVVREKAEKLESLCEQIIACRVTIAADNRNRWQGHLHQVTVDLTVPGAELVVTRDSDRGPEIRDLRSLIREAFSAVRRQLEEHLQRLRGS